MFASFSCNFSAKAKFKDKFIFNGGQIDPSSPIKIISESESFLGQDDCVIDWWILDSIRLKRILPFQWYRPLSDNPFLAPFRFHFFSLDDEMPNSLIEVDELPIDLIISLVKRFGASVSDSIDPSTTHIVTQFQCEHLLPTQLLGPVHFVTLSWLIKILSEGKYTEPMDAIDFPCPIHSIPESSSINVCLSGFTASNRKLLTAQLSLMGISVTTDLSPKVSHLICDRLEGRKFEMATVWGIKIVQRGWIDDCYKRWRII